LMAIRRENSLDFGVRLISLGEAGGA
jgi:hypothetical protein